MKTKELIYQIFPRTFKDGSQRGTGDLKGIIEKLDYLQWLGVNRIWLCPIFTSPFEDSGYDVANYYEIDARFGTMKDLDQLIEEAKLRGIGLIFDMVFNHTSSQHQWFQKALAGDTQYQDYYFFKAGEENQPPTNWKSKMGSSVWKYVPKLKKYYFHLFAEGQPDLNWENPEVQKEILKILNFWIEKGIKGFRFDVCNLYDKSRGFENDEQGDGRRFYTDGPKIPQYFTWMNQNSFGRVKDFLTVGEISSTTKEKSIQYVTPMGKKLDTIFTFLHLKVDFKNNEKWTYMVPPDLQKFALLMEEWQMYFQENEAYSSLFLNSHDQPRSLSRFGDEKKWWFQSGTGMAAFMYLMRGITFIYQGEEIGMTNYPFQSLNDFWDVETLGNIKDLKNDFSDAEILKIVQTKARDNSRTVMQWNSEKNAGFSEQTKIPVNPNYLKINVEEQMNNPHSILNFYQKIFVLKKNEAPIYEGNIQFLKLENLFGYFRQKDSQKIWVVFNWSDKDVKLKENLWAENAQIILNNYQEFRDQVLQPYQVIVVRGDHH